MSLSTSRALFKAMLDTAPFNVAMDGCVLKVYGGTVPANASPSLPAAEAALGSATLLCTFTDNGGAGYLSWESAAEDNVISKSASQVWKGTVAATGTATFFRIVLPDDDGTASTTALRMQGAVGVAVGELLIANTAFTAAELRTINSFFFALTACTGAA